MQEYISKEDIQTNIGKYGSQIRCLITTYEKLIRVGFETEKVYIYDFFANWLMGKSDVNKQTYIKGATETEIIVEFITHHENAVIKIGYSEGEVIPEQRITSSDINYEYEDVLLVPSALRLIIPECKEEDITNYIRQIKHRFSEVRKRPFTLYAYLITCLEDLCNVNLEDRIKIPYCEVIESIPQLYEDTLKQIK